VKPATARERDATLFGLLLALKPRKEVKLDEHLSMVR